MISQLLKSQSEHIDLKRYRSLIPEINIEYKYDSKNDIRITLNSESEFFNGLDSYSEFQLLLTSIGVQSLFISIKISLLDETSLGQIDGYGKICSIFRDFSFPENQAIYVKGPLSADSVENFTYSSN